MIQAHLQDIILFLEILAQLCAESLALGQNSQRCVLQLVLQAQKTLLLVLRQWFVRTEGQLNVIDHLLPWLHERVDDQLDDLDLVRVARELEAVALQRDDDSAIRTDAWRFQDHTCLCRCQRLVGEQVLDDLPAPEDNGVVNAGEAVEDELFGVSGACVDLVHVRTDHGLDEL